jgi:sugar phosphate isomerase/epimerase
LAHAGRRNMAYRHAMRRDQIGLQLYTVRRLAAADLPGTLRAVAAAGYRAVEIAGLPETPPDRLAGLLEENGLQPIAAHESLDHLRANASEVADRLTKLRCPRVIVPSFPDTDRETANDVRRFARELGAFAATFAERGIRLGYHNHSFEFEDVDGGPLWEMLLAELPQEVDIELDVYWAAVGGRDPVSEIQSTAGRVRLLHLKDRAEGPDLSDAPPGHGTLDMDAIVKAGRRAGVEWYIVEQDEPQDPLVDIAAGLRYLETLVD